MLCYRNAPNRFESADFLVFILLCCFTSFRIWWIKNHTLFCLGNFRLAKQLSVIGEICDLEWTESGVNIEKELEFSPQIWYGIFLTPLEIYLCKC